MDRYRKLRSKENELCKDTGKRKRVGSVYSNVEQLLSMKKIIGEKLKVQRPLITNEAKTAFQTNY